MYWLNPFASHTVFQGKGSNRTMEADEEQRQDIQPLKMKLQPYMNFNVLYGMNEIKNDPVYHQPQLSETLIRGHHFRWKPRATNVSDNHKFQWDSGIHQWKAFNFHAITPKQPPLTFARLKGSKEKEHCLELYSLFLQIETHATYC